MHCGANEEKSSNGLMKYATLRHAVPPSQPLHKIVIQGNNALSRGTERGEVPANEGSAGRGGDFLPNAPVEDRGPEADAEKQDEAGEGEADLVDFALGSPAPEEGDGGRRHALGEVAGGACQDVHRGDGPDSQEASEQRQRHV